MPLIIAGSDIRATPPSRRISAGTRSSAITAQAPASSATFASSGVTTSMITPPFNISARPVLTRKVARSLMGASYYVDRPAPSAGGGGVGGSPPHGGCGGQAPNPASATSRRPEQRAVQGEPPTPATGPAGREAR